MTVVYIFKSDIKYIRYPLYRYIGVYSSEFFFGFCAEQFPDWILEREIFLERSQDIVNWNWNADHFSYTIYFLYISHSTTQFQGGGMWWIENVTECRLV